MAPRIHPGYAISISCAGDANHLSLSGADMKKAPRKKIMQESTGANKYFRHSSYMKYPRLRLAIEHNHKEFVGK